MFTSNPFAELSASVPPAVMQAYVAVMVFLVVAGTLFDIVHKRSATYFFNNWRNAKKKAKRRVGAVEMVSATVQTAVVDVMTSGEFCNLRRRIAHLLTMYGFVIYVVTTAIMVFAYPMPATPTPAILPILWVIGALMVCGGGYWFWFFIRVDVAAEGNSPFRFVRADLFIVALVLSTTLALLWACVQATGLTAVANVFLALYLITTTVLFGIDSVVQVLSHVLQTRCRPGEKSSRSKRHAGATCRPPPTAPQTFGSVLKHSGHY